MEIKGFHHVALAAADFDTSLRFYTEGLGFKLYAKWGTPEKTIALLDIGCGEYIELFSNGIDKPEENSRYMHLAFKTDDVEGMVSKAIAAGAKPHIAPKLVHTGSSPVDLTINCGFVIGPDGEKIEFFRVAEEN